METKTTPPCPIFGHIDWSSPAQINHQDENYFIGAVSSELTEEDMSAFGEYTWALSKREEFKDVSVGLELFSKAVATMTGNESITKREMLMIMAGYKLGVLVEMKRNPLSMLFR